MGRVSGERFFILQGLFLGAILVWLAWRFLRSARPESGFRVREADRSNSLPLGGAPHELLGVPPDAPAELIQSAYRNLMKRYHPDRVARPGTPEWHHAQKAAEAINRARDQMMSALGTGLGKARGDGTQSPPSSQ